MSEEGKPSKIQDNPDTDEEELLPTGSTSVTITIEELAKVVSVITGVKQAPPAPPSGNMTF